MALHCSDPYTVLTPHPSSESSRGMACAFKGTAAPHRRTDVRPLRRAAQSSRCSANAAPDTAVAAKVPLGKTGLEVPAIGIGAWSWGDKFFWNDGSWDASKETATQGAFLSAMDSGLSFFDTAEVYGTKQFGGEDSEKLLGKPGLWGNEDYIEGLADCVELGLTKTVGVSNYREARLRKAHAQLAARGVPLASNQVHYNLLYRLPENNGVKKTCEELGVSLIAYSPLAQGVLSGKYNPQNPPTGPRANSYTPSFLKKAVPLMSRIRELGEEYGKTPTQVSLNWLVCQGNVIPIPGAKNRAQAEEFLGALGWSLTPPQVEELRALASHVPPVQGFPVEAF